MRCLNHNINKKVTVELHALKVLMNSEPFRFLILMTPVTETNKHVHGWWMQRRTSLVDDVFGRTVNR